MNTIKLQLQIALIKSENDANIADIIMDYLTIKCDGCKDYCLYEDGEEIECNCSADTDEEDCKQDYFFCDSCVEIHCCYDCRNYYCSHSVDNGYELRKCADDDCDRKFCDDCENESFLWCSHCEGQFCCRGVRRYVDSALEYYYICDVCNNINNCEYFNARH